MVLTAEANLNQDLCLFPLEGTVLS